METYRRKWSEEEISRLKQIMTKYTVDTEGCKYAAQELGRPFKGVYIKWYSIKPNKRVNSPKIESAKILYNNISKYSGNISKAIRKTAEQTGKSKYYIEGIYYKKSSPYNYRKAPDCFNTISENKMSSNHKNSDSSPSQKTTKQKIKQFIVNIFGITKKDL